MRKIILFALIFDLNSCSKPKKAEIHFKSSDMTFVIRKGETYKGKFSFTNTGNDSLKLIDVMAACGCTNVTYDKKPIPAGHTGEIYIDFDSNLVKDKVVAKTVLVRTNTDPMLNTLYVKGSIQE